MPAISAAIRAPAILDYVRGLEYRKEKARLIAKGIAHGVDVFALLANPDATAEKILTALIAELNREDLIDETGREAIGHLSMLGIEKAGASLDHRAIGEGAMRKVLGEADAILTARAAEVARSIARMVEEGAADEVIARAFTGKAGEAVIGPLISSLAQTAAGIIGGVDTAVTREATELDSAMQSLGAAAATEEMSEPPGYAWETREDEKVCDDLLEDSCAPRHGLQLPLSEWEAWGLPAAENLICTMFSKGAASNCRCKLVRPDLIEQAPAPIRIEEAAAEGKALAQSEGIPSAASSEGVARVSSKKSPGLMTEVGVQPAPGTLTGGLAGAQTSILPEPSARTTSLNKLSPTQVGGTSTATTVSSGVVVPIKPPLQPPGSVDDLLRLGVETKPRLVPYLESIAQERGNVDVHYAGARVKEKGPRLLRKLESKTPQQISDYLGGRLLADDRAALDWVIGKLEGGPYEILKKDDFLAAGKFGYRAVHLDVRMPTGLSVEIQVIPTEVGQIKEQWETYVYKKWRDFEGKIPAALRTAYARDYKEMEAAFTEAYRRWETGLNVGPNELLPGPLQKRTINDEWEAFFKEAGLTPGFGREMLLKRGFTPADIAEVEEQEQVLMRFFYRGYGGTENKYPVSGETVEQAIARGYEATKLDTAGMEPEALNARLVDAGISTKKGEITIWHITSDPEGFTRALESGADPMKTFNGGTAVLGKGIYGSAVPENWAFWAGRRFEGPAGAEWQFLEGMSLDKRKVYGQAVFDLLRGGVEEAGWKAKIASFVETGVDPGFASLSMGDVDISSKKFLEPLGIKWSPHLHAVKVRVRGIFADVSKAANKNMWIDEAEALRALGFDGAFVPYSTEPGQFVVWNRYSIIDWTLDDAAIEVAPGMGYGGGGYASGRKK